MNVRTFYFTLVFLLLVPCVAFGWGPGVHLYLGNVLLAGCAVLIPPAASLVRKFKKHFLYGSLSADFFVGKGYKTNGGKCHNWETGIHLWNKASADEERAFAAGFLAHLAADTVAHGHFVPDFSRRNGVPGRIEHLYWEWIADHHVSDKESRTFIKSTCITGTNDRCIFTEMDDYLCNVLTLDKGLYLSRKSLYLYSVRFATSSPGSTAPALKRKAVFQKAFQFYMLASLDRMVSVLNSYENSPFIAVSPNILQQEL